MRLTTLRYIVGSLTTRVVIDRDRTLAARKKYPLFTSLIVARIDSSFPLYRIFDGAELQHILNSGKVTGGLYSVKAERDHGASWGNNINDVVAWGNGQRGKRLGQDIYLAKIDGFDKWFAHLDPELSFDPQGPDEQPTVMAWKSCNTSLGCSVIDVGVGDVDRFYLVREDGQIEGRTLADLRAERATPVPATTPQEEQPKFGLMPGDKVVVTKGSSRRGLLKGNYGTVKFVEHRPGFGKAVFVVVQFVYPLKPQSGPWHRGQVLLKVNHPNRLTDPEIQFVIGGGDERVRLKRR